MRVLQTTTDDDRHQQPLLVWPIQSVCEGGPVAIIRPISKICLSQRNSTYVLGPISFRLSQTLSGFIAKLNKATTAYLSI